VVAVIRLWHNQLTATKLTTKLKRENATSLQRGTRDSKAKSEANKEEEKLQQANTTNRAEESMKCGEDYN
jgi:hypothetical protein